jgi:hypothetical protein
MKDNLGALPPATCFDFNGKTYLRTSEEVDDNFRMSEWGSTRIRCVDLTSGDIKCLKKDILVEPSSVNFVYVPRKTE